MKNEESDNIIPISYETIVPKDVELDLKRKNSGDLKNKNKKHKKENIRNTYILFVTTNEDEAEPLTPPRIYKFNAYNKYLESSIKIVIDLLDKDINMHVDTWNTLFFISEHIVACTGGSYEMNRKTIEHNFSKEFVHNVFKILPEALLVTHYGIMAPFIKELQVKDIVKYSRKKTLIGYLMNY